MLPETPALSVDFRADLNLLIARWLRDVSKSELQQGYREVLRVAIEHQVSGWLVDSRRRTQSSDEMVNWLAEEYLPEISPALNNRPVHLACLVSAIWQPGTAPVTPLAVLAQSGSEPDQQQYEVQLFSDEGAATSWLQQTTSP